MNKEQGPVLNLPAIIDVVAPVLMPQQDQTKICPIMGMHLLPMPSGSGSVLSNQQPQVVLTRQYAPCVRERCQLWNEGADECKIGHALDVLASHLVNLP